jgi:hypothetical protein
VRGFLYIIYFVCFSLIFDSAKRCENICERSILREAVKKLRVKLWGQQSMVKRKQCLRKMLTNMLSTNANGAAEVAFRVNGKSVCKDFFRVRKEHTSYSAIISSFVFAIS